ncbi:hypothetical protein ZIOFF_015547 [Zingiber officinale]|uniref:Uncharacterized protein n=1 Tax=Zingiber officinale TaxID=94328 RepID=A0A8J5LQC7_ZINOF|nr:hypothetical protein ZIOFF_015547 [Zingiber officinale]
MIPPRPAVANGREELLALINNGREEEARVWNDRNIAPNERLMLDEGFLFLYSPPEQVKLNPSLADAWLSLGNCIWKKGDLPSAKNCFSLSLSKGPNKKILCQLSMLERSMAQGKHTIPWLFLQLKNTLLIYFTMKHTGTENKAASIEESITHAREAVQLDIRDGNSWYNLGNACLTSFFVTGTWDHAKLQQALKAYQNAEKDALMHSNPDLYFNCASANKYLENYERALHGFEAASLRDPGLNAESEAQKIVSLLEKIESSMKVMTRAKRLASLVSSLDEISLKSSHRKVSINTLKEGLNKAVAVIGKILLFIKHEDIAPFIIYYYAFQEKDALMHSNPDLYFNCASANKYLENYERALHGFEAASLRDPGLNAESEAQKIVSLLEKIESSMKVTYSFMLRRLSDIG